MEKVAIDLLRLIADVLVVIFTDSTFVSNKMDS